jgi:hypothetical protein
MAMLPVTVTQQLGARPGNQFLGFVVQKRPATEAPKSPPESAQKTTTAGTNWEKFGFHCGAGAHFTEYF